MLLHLHLFSSSLQCPPCVMVRSCTLWRLCRDSSKYLCTLSSIRPIISALSTLSSTRLPSSLTNRPLLQLMSYPTADALSSSRDVSFPNPSGSLAPTDHLLVLHNRHTKCGSRMMLDGSSILWQPRAHQGSVGTSDSQFFFFFWETTNSWTC